MSNPSEIERFLQEKAIELQAYLLTGKPKDKQDDIISSYQDALKLIEDLSARVHG